MRPIWRLAVAGSLLSSAAAGEEAAVSILKANCAGCHRQKNRSSGLSLESRANALSGGNRGPAIVAGDPDASLLIKAVEQSGDLKMPPGRKLGAAEIASLREWIKAGLPWAGEAKSESAAARHWAFQPLVRPAVPEVPGADAIRNPIDRFILAKLAGAGVAPSTPADRYTLLRRVSLDLIGLPPTPKEIADFLADRSPDAYEKVVDRLLMSPHYGERWARQWLDLARYADSDGYTIDDPRQIWRYRDWVIRALNSDMPFDRFTIEQLSGDLLPNPTVDQLVATGFHRNTPSNYEGGIDQEQYRVEAVADRVATTGSVWLGLTLGCARCHDHKYDPVTQKEFYQLFAYFNNVEAITKDSERNDHNRPRLEFPKPGEREAREAYLREREKLSETIAEYRKKAGAAADGTGDTDLASRDTAFQALQDKLREVESRQPRIDYTLIMRELPAPRETYIHLGGDFLRKGITVSAAVPSWLGPKAAGATRLDLAKWLVDPANPLPARVTVNRMWQTFFGRGLVETSEDLGTAGSKPTHVELLDWLAAEFIARGWSQKAMHRLIVTSAVYRFDSRQSPALQEKDPYNYLLARQSRLRLDAEILRDVALAASGRLTPVVGGPSVFPPMPPGAMALTQIRKPWPTEYGANRYRRGLYTFAYRASLHPALGLFDAPDGATSCTRRVRSNSPLQALTLLNDMAYVDLATGLAGRVLKEGGRDDAARMNYAFELALGRRARPAEMEKLSGFLANQRDVFQTAPAEARSLLRNERAAREAAVVADVKPQGAQSPIGLAESTAMHERAAAVKAAGERAAAAWDGLPEKEAVEMAAWVSVARVLFNLDDCVTRN